MATIANGGVHHTPYVVQKIVGPDGKVLLDKQRPRRPGPRRRRRRCEQNILRTASSTGGTGGNADVAGHDVVRQDGHHRQHNRRVVHRRHAAARDRGVVRQLAPATSGARRASVATRRRRLPGVHDRRRSRISPTSRCPTPGPVCAARRRQRRSTPAAATRQRARRPVHARPARRSSRRVQQLPTTAHRAAAAPAPTTPAVDRPRGDRARTGTADSDGRARRAPHAPGARHRPRPTAPPSPDASRTRGAARRRGSGAAQLDARLDHEPSRTRPRRAARSSSSTTKPGRSRARPTRSSQDVLR